MNHFHDHNGMLIVGLDRHFGIHWPTPFPIPMFFWELNVMHPFWMGPGKPSVMFNGFVSVADQHTARILWPHIPVIPDPLNMLFPLDLVMGNQKTWMAKGTVLVEGSPGAITLIPGPWSLNMDCWTGSNLPPGIVFQPGTVVTSASWQDWLRAGLRLAYNIVMEYIACRSAVAKRTRQGRIPARPANYGWRNVRRNIGYMGRRDLAGQRARSTFRNTLGREFASRLSPWKSTRDARGNPTLAAPRARDVGTWLGGNLDLPVTQGGRRNFGQNVLDNVTNGRGPMDGILPDSPQSVPGDVMTGNFPQYDAVTGLQQSQGNRDFDPFH
jgi:hypothetical protein